MYLRLVAAELSVAVRQTLQSYRELDVTASDDILDLEFCKLGVEAELLYNTSIFARRQSRVIFALRTRDDHLARCEDERGGLGFADTHDDCGETLMCKKRIGVHKYANSSCNTNLWIILCVARMEGNRL